MDELRRGICRPGMARLLHFGQSKNSPLSSINIKQVCFTCRICTLTKSQFYVTERGTLYKATKPTQSSSLYFKMNQLFSLCSMPNCIHSDLVHLFTAREVEEYLMKRGSYSTQFMGNLQAERYNEIVCKAIRLALKPHILPVDSWEAVVWMRYIVFDRFCVGIQTPHELLFNFVRASPNAKILLHGCLGET